MEHTRIIFKPALARKLLKMGYTICDIKPQKQKDGSVDFTRCMFVFSYNDGIDEIIEQETNKKNN